MKNLNRSVFTFVIGILTLKLWQDTGGEKWGYANENRIQFNIFTLHRT